MVCVWYGYLSLMCTSNQYIMKKSIQFLETDFGFVRHAHVSVEHLFLATAVAKVFITSTLLTRNILVESR